MTEPGHEQIGTRRNLLFIPAYNCEKQIRRVIAQLQDDVLPYVSEVIVVNNRSTDDTERAAIDALQSIQGLPFKVIRNNANYGLGGSHKVALAYARQNGFDTCIVLHGDDQGSIKDLLPHMDDPRMAGADCLLGARFMPGSRLAGYSPLRTFGNLVFNWLYSAVSGRRIHDLGAGLNLYRVSAFDRVDYLRCADDLTFNYHLLVRSIAAGLQLRFFPLEWREDDQISNVKLFSQSLKVLNVALGFGFARKSYLARNYASQPNQAYPYTVVASWGAAQESPQ